MNARVGDAQAHEAVHGGERVRGAGQYGRVADTATFEAPQNPRVDLGAQPHVVGIDDQPALHSSRCQ